MGQVAALIVLIAAALLALATACLAGVSTYRDFMKPAPMPEGFWFVAVTGVVAGLVFVLACVGIWFVVHA